MELEATQSFAEAVAEAINLRLQTWKMEDYKSSFLYAHCYPKDDGIRVDIYRPLDKPLFRYGTLSPAVCDVSNGVGLKLQTDGIWYPLYDDFERLFGKVFDLRFNDFERIAFTDL